MRPPTTGQHNLFGTAVAFNLVSFDRDNASVPFLLSDISCRLYSSRCAITCEAHITTTPYTESEKTPAHKDWFFGPYESCQPQYSAHLAGYPPQLVGGPG